jgi:hypothetical protein
MFNPHCSVCQDKKHFTMDVSEARRIAFRLKQLKVRHKDILNNIDVDMRAVNTLKSSCHMPHMMCGHCYKVNDMELKRYHEQIAKHIVEIKEIIISGKLDKQKQGALKGEAHNYVRGHFTMIAQYIYKVQTK